jgi:hypothetical protein
VLSSLANSRVIAAYRLSVRTNNAELTKGIAAMLASHLTAP